MSNDKFPCKYCNKEYSSKQSRTNHCSLYHREYINNNHQKPPILKKNQCEFCNKIFSRIDSLSRHINLNRCKKKVSKDKDFIQIKLEVNNLNDKIIELSKKNNNESNYPINNHLIDIIVDKTKSIQILKTEIENKESNTEKIIEIYDEIKLPSLTLNNINIISREKDNYINIIQLCQAGDKKFNDWFQLNTTKELINEIMSETGIPVSQLIDSNLWIHPDLAIQLAQWISPIFSMHVTKWIRKLFINEYHHKEIKSKNHKIQLLQDSFIKKQKRITYPEKNVIYMLTTEDNKKKRNYIIGKTINLKKRLSSYNKTTEHQVVYYKTCNNEEDMNVIEIMILNKLKEYKEKANRDRFILPIEKDITFFINIINSCINFVTETNKK